jgi:hypothetical protein
LHRDAPPCSARVRPNTSNRASLPRETCPR